MAGKHLHADMPQMWGRRCFCAKEHRRACCHYCLHTAARACLCLWPAHMQPMHCLLM